MQDPHLIQSATLINITHKILIQLKHSKFFSSHFLTGWKLLEIARLQLLYSKKLEISPQLSSAPRELISNLHIYNTVQYFCTPKKTGLKLVLLIGTDLIHVTNIKII
jgi:hypothetical protein